MNYAKAAAELRGLRRELRDVRFANGTANITDHREVMTERYRSNLYSAMWMGERHAPDPPISGDDNSYIMTGGIYGQMVASSPQPLNPS